MQPTRLGPYRIERKIGRGGMGTVYVGVEEYGNDAAAASPSVADAASRAPRVAAVKVLAPSLADDSAFRQRFDAEIESLKKLMHPGIVRLYGFGEEDDYIFYAMEFVDGPSLEEELRAGRRFNWRETADLAIQIARALRHAHDSGVIHRDLKPANLLLADDEHVKLSDFGIARLFGHRLTGSGSVIGTAEFMAPEQADGRAVTPRCDLYSLGCVMYAMLTGQPPFRADSMPAMLDRHRHEVPAPVRQFAPDVPADMERLIARLLEKSPEARYPTAQSVARELEAMIDRLTLGSSRAQPVTPAAASSANEGSNANAGPSCPTLASYDERKASRLNGSGGVGVGAGIGGGTTAVVGDGRASDREPTQPSSTSRFEMLPRQASASRTSVWRFLFAALPTALALVAMIVLTLYLLRGPTDDERFAQIQAAANEDDVSALVTKEAEVNALLERFDDADPRAEQLRDYQLAIELARLERRLARGSIPSALDRGDTIEERLLADAVRIAASDPERGVTQLELIVELYDAATERSTAARQAVAIAEKHLQRLRPLAAERITDQKTLISKALAHAESLRTCDMPAARRIWQSLIKQYDAEPWAADLLPAARAGLSQSPDTAIAAPVGDHEPKNR